MADQTTVHIGENSPQQVAYRLFRDIMVAEGKSLREEDRTSKVNRKYILDTYAECLSAVGGYRDFGGS